MDKHGLRLKIKTDLQELDETTYLEKSKSLSKNLLSVLPEIISKHCIESLKLGVYSPFQREPIWFSEFEKNLYEYLIVHMHKDSHLSFHPVDLKTLKSEKISLEIDSKLRDKEVTPNVILVPGLAFTKEGERLGRGKGYFDKYLENSQSIKIGICFDLQIKPDVLAKAHDIEMDYVITETNIYK